MSLYFTETQDISYKHISQTDYQYFMTKRKNACMYTPKINYLTIILHSICGKPHIYILLLIGIYISVWWINYFQLIQIIKMYYYKYNWRLLFSLPLNIPCPRKSIKANFQEWKIVYLLHIFNKYLVNKYLWATSRCPVFS